jgi:hypothetical protein
MAEMNEVYDALRKADAAGDVEGAKRLTQYIQGQTKTEKTKTEQPKEKGFVERFGETFAPVKAITEEGIIPQLASAAKRAVTGEEAPKAQEKPEETRTVGQTLKNMVNYAKQDPGAFAGTVANAIIADPELLLMPEFLPARVLSSIEKVSKLGGSVAKTADAATQAAAMAAGQSAARQLNERGTIDMDVLKSDVKSASAIGAGARATGEVGRAVLPGAEKYATAGSKEAIDLARKEGYTVPLKELSPLGGILDKYYKTPLEKINKEKFVEDITAPTGTKVTEINTTTLPQIYKNLTSEVDGIVANEKVLVPSNISDSVADSLKKTLPKTDLIDNAVTSIENGVEISGKTWHKIRSELSTRKFKAVQSDNQLVADDIDQLINRWDGIAQAKGNFSAKATKDFNSWKQKYTAFSDIREAIQTSESAMKNYLEGKLMPSDVMNGIRKRRSQEALMKTYTSRPQTKTAAISAGLDLLGEKGPVATSWFGATLPKLAAGAVAKPVQALGYTPLGQEMFYRGLPNMPKPVSAPMLGFEAEQAGK